MRRFNSSKLAFARTLDPVLAALFSCMGRRRRHGPIDDREIRRILVFEFQFLGDVVMATPALRALRKRFPEASITLAGPAAAAGIERHLPWVDEVVTFDCPWASHRYDWAALVRTCRFVKRLRSAPWDLAVEIRGDLRHIVLAFLSGARRRVGFAITGGGYLLTDVVPYDDTFLRHQLEGNLEVFRHLGCDVSENFPELALDPASERRAWEFLQNMKRPVVGIHPCASKANKLWEVEKWIELIERVAREEQASVVLLHGPAPLDRELAERVYNGLRSREKCHRFSRSLSDLISVIHGMDLLIALDSAASHIAAAVGTPFITLFGPQDPAFTRPYHYRGRVVSQAGFSCPCRASCIYGTDNRCMKGIEVEDVWGAFKELMGSIRSVAGESNRAAVYAG